MAILQNLLESMCSRWDLSHNKTPFKHQKHHPKTKQKTPHKAISYPINWEDDA
jgi:hypothetical protein